MNVTATTFSTRVLGRTYGQTELAAKAVIEKVVSAVGGLVLVKSEMKQLGTCYVIELIYSSMKKELLQFVTSVLR